MQNSRRFHWVILLLSGMLTAGSTFAESPEQAPLPQPTSDAATSSAQGTSQDLLERLSKMEQRLDWLMQQNDGILRERKLRVEPIPNDFRSFAAPGPEIKTSGALSDPAIIDMTQFWNDGTEAFSSQDPGAESGLSGALSQPRGSSDGSAPVAGGGSKASGGGDPTSIGRAQEVGNLHLGKVTFDSYYDFDDGGFHLASPDREFTFALRGMTQIDGMLYSRPTPGLQTSSGFYNPRSRIYFEGTVTEPISWEFSFQNFYDTVALLDAYVNFNYDPRFQVQIGRFKNPFGYEFYRIHVWDLMAPERSLWANNFEANRRFGLMGHGDLFDQRVEYAAGTFDTQRNSLRPSDDLQDFEAFLNLKPFYPADEGCVLRNLQFGGSVDVGNENQTPVPDVLRTDQSPGGAAAQNTTASNAAGLPFLAFNPTVLEKGHRALWELHLAYYYEGLSLVTALEGGHESYASGPAASPVQIPIHGWFAQAGYLLTGETIRDRTLIQPLRPFDLRQGRFGLGAWEVTARFSQLDLGSQVFSAGLADPNLWTNHAKLIDVGANWYLNQFVKVAFDWEHSLFGTPVVTTDGDFRKSNDLFWVRTQIYF